MKKFIAKFLILFSLVFSILFIVNDVFAAQHNIIIIHTNDIHCNVNQNIGFGMLSRGKDIVNIINAVRYDFCVPGNHEFDYGMKHFLQLLEIQKSGYYCANIVDKKSKKTLLPAYRIFNFEGTKIAFIGVTTPETLRASTPKFFQDSSGRFVYSFYEDIKGEKLYSKIQSVVDEVKNKGVEYIFIVAHLGVNNIPNKWSRVEISKHINGITGIIDVHSHEMFNYIAVNKNGQKVLIHRLVVI